MITRALVFAVLVSLLGAAHAQSARDDAGGSDQALRKAQALLRQVAQEKTRLEGENVKLLAEIDALKGQLKRAQATLEETSGALETASQSNATLSARLGASQSRVEQTEDQLRDVVAKYKELDGEHRELTAVREELDQTVAVKTREISECEGKNIRMFEANVELLGHYAGKTAWDALAQREPFTGLKQVEIENILQEYRFKLEDLQYRKPEDVTAEVGP